MFYLHYKKETKTGYTTETTRLKNKSIKIVKNRIKKELLVIALLDTKETKYELIDSFVDNIKLNKEYNFDDIVTIKITKD